MPRQDHPAMPLPSFVLSGDRAAHLHYSSSPGYPPCGRRRSPLLWQAPAHTASTRRHGSRTIGRRDPDEAFDMYKSTTSAIR